MSSRNIPKTKLIELYEAVEKWLDAPQLAEYEYRARVIDVFDNCTNAGATVTAAKRVVAHDNLKFRDHARSNYESDPIAPYLDPD